jgi:hypothetical protein
VLAWLVPSSLTILSFLAIIFWRAGRIEQGVKGLYDQHTETNKRVDETNRRVLRLENWRDEYIQGRRR